MICQRCGRTEAANSDFCERCWRIAQLAGRWKSMTDHERLHFVCRTGGVYYSLCPNNSLPTTNGAPKGSLLLKGDALPVMAGRVASAFERGFTARMYDWVGVVIGLRNHQYCQIFIDQLAEYDYLAVHSIGCWAIEPVRQSFAAVLRARAGGYGKTTDLHVQDGFDDLWSRAISLTEYTPGEV